MLRCCDKRKNRYQHTYKRNCQMHLCVRNKQYYSYKEYHRTHYKAGHILYCISRNRLFLGYNRPFSELFTECKIEIYHRKYKSYTGNHSGIVYKIKERITKRCADYYIGWVTAHCCTSAKVCTENF